MIILNFVVKGQSFNYYVDLNHVVNDQVKVLLTLPALYHDTVIFYFPKVVPGTYSIGDYGRFISNFKAYGANNELKVKKKGINTFVIYQAKDLEKIEYTVNDTWDSKIKKHKIFSPAGSSFEEDKVFLLNSSCLFGCFEGYELRPFIINYNVPDTLTGASALNFELHSGRRELKLSNYYKLIDNPVMFAIPDTTSIVKNDWFIKITVYNDQNKSISDSIKPKIEQCLASVEKFWGYLPVKNYAFIFYIPDYSNQFKNLQQFPERRNFRFFNDLDAGALEHKNSSVYVLPDLGSNIISPVFETYDYRGFLNEVVTHEYMHTVTPIGLHSYEIGEFQLLKPQMSKHLWLYEGVTDYFAMLILLQNDIIDIDDYFNEYLKLNMIHAEKYPYQKMSMIEMSEHVLKNRYHKNYDYVYTHGNILAFMLDIEIIRLSEGQLTLKNVVKKLYEKYGYDRSFDDDHFINEFLSLVPDSISDFFEKYIYGKQKLDYNRYLKYIGIHYFEKDTLYMPSIISSDNGIIDFRVKNIPLTVNGEIEIIMTTSNSVLKSGDKINIFEADNLLFNGTNPIVEKNDTVWLNVKRGSLHFQYPFKVVYRNSEFRNFFVIDTILSDQIEKYRNVWLGKRSK